MEAPAEPEARLEAMAMAEAAVVCRGAQGPREPRGMDPGVEDRRVEDRRAEDHQVEARMEARTVDGPGQAMVRTEANLPRGAEILWSRRLRN